MTCAEKEVQAATATSTSTSAAAAGAYRYIALYSKYLYWVNPLWRRLDLLDGWPRSPHGAGEKTGEREEKRCVVKNDLPERREETIREYHTHPILGMPPERQKPLKYCNIIVLL